MLTLIFLGTAKFYFYYLFITSHVSNKVSGKNVNVFTQEVNDVRMKTHFHGFEIIKNTVEVDIKIDSMYFGI